MAATDPIGARQPDQVARVKARLNPKLNEPYFQLHPKYMAMAKNQCTHENHGVDLIEVDRSVLCKGCRKHIDPFDALLHYAASEQRLIATRNQIAQMQQREADKKSRAKARRPFVRKVVRWIARKDMTLKAEPVIGYDIELECGHSGKCGPDRKVKNITCRECEMAALKPTKGRSSPLASP